MCKTNPNHISNGQQKPKQFNNLYSHCNMMTQLKTTPPDSICSGRITTLSSSPLVGMLVTNLYPQKCPSSIALPKVAMVLILAALDTSSFVEQIDST